MLKKIALLTLAPLSLTFLMITGLNASAKEVRPTQAKTSEIQAKSREVKMTPSREISNKSSESKHPTSHKPKHRVHPSSQSQPK